MRAIVLTALLVLTACGRDEEKQPEYPFDPAYKPDRVQAPAKIRPTPVVTPTATPTPPPTASPTPLPAPRKTRVTFKWREGDTAIQRDAQGNLLPRNTDSLPAKERVFEVDGEHHAGLIVQHDSYPPGGETHQGKRVCTSVRGEPVGGINVFDYVCDLGTLGRNCTIDAPAELYHFVAPIEAKPVDSTSWTVRFADAPGGWCATLD